MAKLVLIDSHAILHRAYHALPEMNFKRGGQLSNAVYGFFSMLLKAVFELHPDHLIACFDAPGPKFRNQDFIGYQANRAKMEDELGQQIEATRQALKEAGIPVLIKQGFEADDLIGTVAKKAKRKMDRIVIITGDKDLMQLVDKKVNLFLLVRGITGAEMVNPKEVENRLGVKPVQVVDYKGLAGDPSDNYPGVAGIGPKTATKLLDQLGTLKAIYQGLEKVAPSVREKLERGKDSAFLSQGLAQIRQNLPVKFSLSESKWDDQKLLKLKSVLGELSFPSLVKRIERRFNRGETEKQMSLI